MCHSSNFFKELKFINEFGLYLCFEMSKCYVVISYPFAPFLPFVQQQFGHFVSFSSRILHNFLEAFICVYVGLGW